MKKYSALVLLGLGILLGSRNPVQAGTFETASRLRPGGFSLGLEPAAGFSPAQFIFYLHGDVGLTRTIELETKLGFGSYSYFGANLQFGLVPDTNKTVGVAFIGGAHGTSHLGLETALLVSKRFRTFSLYGALDGNFEFVPNPARNETTLEVPFYLNLGVGIPAARNMEVFLEGNLGLDSAANSGFAGGVKFYF